MKKLFLLKLNCFKYFSSFTLILLFIFSADLASAHRVVLFAWIEGDTVFTESQFPDGRKIANGQVNVFDMDHTLLLEGKTDTNGEFSFKIPKKTALNIVLDAGMGHRGQWELSEDEIKSAMGISASEPDKKQTQKEPDTVQTSLNPSSEAVFATSDIHKESGSAVLVDKKQLEQIIVKVLDKKLQPINRMMAQMQYKGPSVNDIFGGIGYILGLMGVAAFFLSKKKNN